MQVMKRLSQKTKQIQSTLVEWVLFKGPELFVSLYS